MGASNSHDCGNTGVRLPAGCPACRKAFLKISSVVVPYVSTKKEGGATPKDDEPFEWLDGNNHQPEFDPYDMTDDGSIVKKK
jgi:hypothetical protein